MFFRYFKGEPNLYVIRYQNGQIKQHGKGLDFWYFPFNTSIAIINAVSQDAPFIFNESTINFQEVAIQGQITYRLEAPLEAEAKADEMKLQPYGNLEPQALIGLALKDFAGNAGKIGNLNITPDMLGQLIGWVGGPNNDTKTHDND